jgi:hypothetical protein
MADPTLLICVGATKAGTSWMYRYLYDHEAFCVRAVKEYLYFTIFKNKKLMRNLKVLNFLIVQYEARFLEAEAADDIIRILNLSRRIDDTKALFMALSAERSDDAAYLGYLQAGRTHETVVLDVTPADALLEPAEILRISKLPIRVKLRYLMRDPLERLWSHVRMVAKRSMKEGQDFLAACQDILKRVVYNHEEAHIVTRGDCKSNITRFTSVFDSSQFQIGFSENLQNGPKFDAMCAHWGIKATSARQIKPAHVGLAAPFPEALRRDSLKFLKTQYDFVADNFAELPANWRKNRELLA